ncbi:hypothetical protein J6590_007917, partial [Homalodisca vitripennis]
MTVTTQGKYSFMTDTRYAIKDKSKVFRCGNKPGTDPRQSVPNNYRLGQNSESKNRNCKGQRSAGLMITE